MLRLAGSLKLGTVQAAAVVKTLRIDDRPTKMAQAVAELGRIHKTIHALTFIADENKRRRILGVVATSLEYSTTLQITMTTLEQCYRQRRAATVLAGDEQVGGAK